MSLSRRFATKGALLAVSATAFACAPDSSGQLMLAVQTDMSLPKDVDAIRIEVFNEGVPKFRKDYERLGTFDQEIRLPGTLALLGSDEPDSAVTVSVSARTGGVNGKVRVMRQVVTTVPQDRIASLQIPLRFICDGSGEDENGEAKNTCPDGQTCIAGSCEDRTIDSSTLPDYEEDDVFAGGSCFDPVSCWNFPVAVDVDPSDCSFSAPADESALNVALAVEGDGICGAAGCFVTLDADSNEGWQLGEDGRIVLPPVVCEKLGASEIVSIVTSSVTSSCPQKKLSLPTCGPWSAASSNSGPYVGPLALAGAQRRPVAFAELGNKLFFGNSRDEDAEGVIKSVSVEGGKVETIALGELGEARDLFSTGSKIFFTSSTGAPEGGAIVQLQGGKLTPLQTKLGSPEGITVAGQKIFWTDFQSGDIHVATDGAIDERTLLASLPGSYPYRIVADATHVYVVTEGTAAESNGSLLRIQQSGAEPKVEALVEGLQTPRALAIELDEVRRATAVYFTTFSENGTVERVSFSSGELQHEILATGLDHPNGIAIDRDTIYWTNWGNGTVSSLPKAAKEGEKPTVIAAGRVAPGAITAGLDTIYWVDEGSSSKPTGSLVKMPKPPHQ